ncbi:MAG: ATP-binding protein [Candidatus Peribacteria bacterium]|nr:MAG: ATP-binding protein [Candidatus Peribacteria bacterium]
MKPANQRMDEGQTSMLPLAIDDLNIPRSMITTSLAGSFPFISNDLIENTGILYGVNLHTGSLVIFDRFSNNLPNANSIVLATSGAGKSFAVKLEILRYLLLGIDVIVIDPENEYKTLTEKVGGTYINISVNSSQYINPFDMPPRIEDIEYGVGDLLRSQILNLISLIGVLVGGITPAEEALLDKALQATYALKEITTDNDDVSNKSFPLMEDLLHVLDGMEGGDNLSLRISKYVTGTFAKLFNNPTNVDINNRLTVFSIRDIEDALKTPAMFNVLNFIWTKVRSRKKKRLLVIDEAWIMMQQEVASNFVYQLVKRARKYGLGVTTITQDVEDFVNSPYGKPIVSNASLQMLLKQSTASIKSLEEVFGLSEAEKQRLVAANIGE